VGDIGAVGVVDGATFALLFARFVVSATHPVVSRKAATARDNPKFRFILFTLLFFYWTVSFGKVCAVEPDSLCVFHSFLRLCVKPVPRSEFTQRRKEKS
jgi:hypothetical protein